MTEVAWPTRPTCHDGRWEAERVGQQTYREPNKPDPDGKYGWSSVRTCSYCGSIAPEDLHSLLTADGPKPRMGGSDWKYGWPHKFYVREIPLPADYIGLRFPTGRRRYTNDAGEQVDEITHWTELGPTSGSGKFYSEHLTDLDTDAFTALAPLVELHTGIHFERGNEGALMYSAPGRGYQR
jgi:hypothetical protein